MKLKLISIIFSFVVIPLITFCQENKFTDEEILEMYKGLRVADVSDGFEISNSLL